MNRVVVNTIISIKFAITYLHVLKVKNRNNFYAKYKITKK